MAQYTLQQLRDAFEQADDLAQSAADPASKAKAAEDAQYFADAIRALQAGPKVGVGEDMARSVPAGLKLGTEQLVGTAEDTGSFLGRGAGKVAGWLGASPETVKSINEYGGNAVSGVLNPVGAAAKGLKAIGGPDLTSYYAPTAETAKQDIESAVPATKSMNYDPQSRAGKFVKTGTSFLPSVLTGGTGTARQIALRSAEQLGAGFLSEGAGQATEGSVFEPWARAAGGVGGSMALTSSLFRKGPPTPAAQRQMDKGNTITAGQAVRSPTIQQFESALGGRRHADIMTGQGQHYGAQAMEELGAPAGTALESGNMLAQNRRIGGELDAVEAGVGNVPITMQHQQGMLDALTNYRDISSAPAPIQGIVSDIGRLMRRGGQPVLNGQQLADLRTRIRTARQTADPSTEQFLNGVQESLDNAVGVHLATSNPELAARWRNARAQYRMYMDLEKAFANSSTENFAQGVLTPAALKGGVKGVEGERRLTQGSSEYAPLVQEGAEAMPKVGSSQSTERGRALLAAGAGASGNLGAAAAAILGPLGAGKVLMSQPVQQFLMSQGDNARAALTSILAAQQDRKRRGGPR